MDKKTVKDSASGSFTEKKSEFIGNIIHAESEEEAVAFIDRIRSENRKARHNVYAYLISEGNISRYSDDGEPQGTAGVPVLEVMKKEGLTDVCLVVTRYFGGILLGTGGLARAYTQAAKLACENAHVIEMCECVPVSFSCDYSLYGMIGGTIAQPYLKQISCDFTDTVDISLHCRTAYSEGLIRELTDISGGKIKPVLGEKLYSGFDITS